MVWILNLLINNKLMFILGIVLGIIFKVASKGVSLYNALSLTIMFFLLTSFFIGALFSFMGYNN